MNELSESVIRINNIYKSMGEQKIRLLTFQSKEVLQIIQRDGRYQSDCSKSREGASQKDYYIKDIEQLNGYNPIWGFSPIEMPKITDNKFKSEDFIDGCKFQRFKEEMSCSSRDINNKYLFEVEVKANKIRRGITHNDCNFAVIFPEIKKNDIVAVYQLHYQPGHPLKWFYCDVNIIEKFRVDTLFKSNFTCHKVARR